MQYTIHSVRRLNQLKLPTKAIYNWQLCEHVGRSIAVFMYSKQIPQRNRVPNSYTKYKMTLHYLHKFCFTINRTFYEQFSSSPKFYHVIEISECCLAHCTHHTEMVLRLWFLLLRLLKDKRHGLVLMR